ncbi:MAG TPA: DUF2238 domain-containing protein [Phycisphaerales bacterium]|nr:DUF2238 domain-containing protein [Phycisphaerales bacterium]
MPTPSGNTYRLILLLIFFLAFAVSCIHPTDPHDFLLEHSLTFAGLIGLVILNHSRPFSNLACTCLFIFFMLHVLGAHYLYSNVPYDQWAQSLTGRTINETLGLRRNSYDRLVHFSFGFLMVVPMRELVVRFLKLRMLGSLLVTLAFLAAFSELYEHIEWLIAATMAPEAAEHYNGQQGDMFDSQKDTSLANIGAIASSLLVLIFARRTIPSPSGGG